MRLLRPPAYAAATGAERPAWAMRRQHPSACTAAAEARPSLLPALTAQPAVAVGAAIVAARCVHHNPGRAGGGGGASSRRAPTVTASRVWFGFWEDSPADALAAERVRREDQEELRRVLLESKRPPVPLQPLEEPSLPPGAASAARRRQQRKERRGKKAEDGIVVARRKGLGTLEVIGGLALGPIAAVAYPGLREFFSDLIKGDQQICLSFMGLCGGIPPNLDVFFKNAVALLFSFLLGNTFSFLLARQAKLSTAIYEESAVITQILEEAPLFLLPEHVLLLVRHSRRYLAAAWRNPSLLPAELAARFLRSKRDAVEDMTRMLIEQTPRDVAGGWPLLQSLRDLRVARARTMAAMQMTIPTVQFFILVCLAALLSLPPFLDGRPDSSALAQCLYGVFVEVLVLVLLAVADLSNPVEGFYNTNQERTVILAAMYDLLELVESEAQADLSAEGVAQDQDEHGARAESEPP